MAQDWTKLSAAEQGRGIAANRIDPVDLVDEYLEKIAGHRFANRIYARLTQKRARAEAIAARRRARDNARLSSLDGVPMSWKDLVDTAGVATESGSALLKDRIPQRDARVLSVAGAQGLVCLGKTHMTELAFSGLGHNPITASPPNVNDHDAVSGGSSSGAAASVAFGLAPIGIGSDTAGSVRLPSAWNDLVGLKTTPGRVSLEGVVPLCPRFDTVGPLARTVEDAALAFAALTGRRPPDLGGVRLDGMHFCVIRTVALDGVEDAPRAAFESALQRLQAAGARVTWQGVPAVARAVELATILFATEAYGTWKTLIESRPDQMFATVLERFRGGASFAGADYVAAWQELSRLRNEYHSATAGYDAVILPSCQIMPPKIADVATDPAYFAERNLACLRNTRIGSLMGLPGLTLPTGIASTGILFQAEPGSEERLLRIGAAVEAALA